MQVAQAAADTGVSENRGMYTSPGSDKNPVPSAQFKLKRRGPGDKGLVQNPKLPPGATIYLSWWLQQAGKWHKSR